MREIHFGNSTIYDRGRCYIIAEIGHNHQGNLDVALDMIKIAAECGVDAVKFQKRDNKNLYTKAMYNKPYDNENSFGFTYGEHRDFLEFGWNEYCAIKECARENGVEFICTAFDHHSVDFLEKLGVTSYKIASGDIVNIPLLKYIAELNKPIFLSTGAAVLDEVRTACNEILKINNKLCVLHSVSMYPAEYECLNLNMINVLKKEFPDTIIGYSGHDNGILAAVVSYMLGATVVEKHFTINRAWKGTDHKFSLEAIGLRKQVRDLRRIESMLGDGNKIIQKGEQDSRVKMGKSLYVRKKLAKGYLLSREDIVVKTPGGGLLPYQIDKIVGKKLKVELDEEASISWEDLEDDK